MFFVSIRFTLRTITQYRSVPQDFLYIKRQRQTPLSGDGSHSLQYCMTSNTTLLVQAYQVSMSVTTQVDEVRENCTVYTCSRLTNSIKYSAQILDTDVMT